MVPMVKQQLLKNLVMTTKKKHGKVRRKNAKESRKLFYNALKNARKEKNANLSYIQSKKL